LGLSFEQNNGRVSTEPEKAVAPKEFSLVMVEEPNRIECSKPSIWKDHEKFVLNSSKMDADATQTPQGKCGATALFQIILSIDFGHVFHGG
jgi:hypothetical protein